jgi:hypothetical protein
MSIALQLYIQLTEAKDDDARARAIADAFEALETRLEQITQRTIQGPVNEPKLGTHGTDTDTDAKLG